MKIIAVGNFKGGSGKTTSAVFLSAAFASLGLKVLLVDTDPQGTAHRWAVQAGGLGFPVEAHPSRTAGKHLSSLRGPRFDVVVVDTPPVAEHAGIVEGVLRAAHTAVLTLAPTLPEYERARDFTDAVTAAGTPELAALLNRTVPRAASTRMVRDALTGDGVRVLRAEVPRREAMAWSFGAAPSGNLGGYLSAAMELNA